MILRRQAGRPAVIGLGLAVLTLAVLTIFPRQMVIEFAAMLLAIIAAVYIGFALPDGRESVKRMEIGTAVLFIVMALVGLWVNLWLLVVGYMGDIHYDLSCLPKSVTAKIPAGVERDRRSPGADAGRL